MRVAATVLLLSAAAVALQVWRSGPEAPGRGSGQGTVGTPLTEDVREGGPLRTHGPSGYTVPLTRGETIEFTDAFENLAPDDARSLTLHSVESVGSSHGLRLLDAHLAGLDRQGNFQFFPRHPPFDRRLGELIDVEGAVIGTTAAERRRGFSLVLVYEATGDEMASRAGLDITYEAGGRAYVQHIPARIIYCGAATQADCDRYRQDSFPDG